jgi:hypothetical protein
MPRDRTRVPLESGAKLDLAQLIPRGAGKPGAKITAEFIGSSSLTTAIIELYRDDGVLTLHSASDHFQTVFLCPSRRHLGGCQWYAVCPRTRERARVLWKPPGASYFASRHAWKRQVAYQSQFLDPIARAWRMQEKIKSRLIGDLNPDEWDLPPKPKWMRWATYNRLEARFDEQEHVKDVQLLKWLGRSSQAP